MMEFAPIKSSQIEAIGHDPESATLAVRFHGGAVYHYPGVTAEEHAGLMAAPSVGSHFHRHFRQRENRRV